MYSTEPKFIAISWIRYVNNSIGNDVVPESDIRKELGPRYHLYFETHFRWGSSEAVSHAKSNRIYT